MAAAPRTWRCTVGLCLPPPPVLRLNHLCHHLLQRAGILPGAARASDLAYVTRGCRTVRAHTVSRSNAAQYAGGRYSSKRKQSCAEMRLFWPLRQSRPGQLVDSKARAQVYKLCSAVIYRFTSAAICGSESIRQELGWLFVSSQFGRVVLQFRHLE